MQFDYLVICTGFSYKNPIKNEKSVTLKDRTKDLEQIYEKVKNSSSILVVGGGYVACEVVAEISAAYGKEKRVGLCTRGDRLLNSLPQKFSLSTESFFKENNI